MSDRLVLCECGGGRPVAPSAFGPDVSLHRTAPDRAVRDAAGGALACCRDAATLDALAEADGIDPPAAIDLHHRALWTDGAGDVGPKLAALLAEARLPARPVKALDVVSEGLCLVLGDPAVALAAAERLRDRLAVTVLLDAPVDDDARGFDVVAGALRGATGSLGAFRVRIDALRRPEPAGRGPARWSAPRDGATTDCDLILDLRAGAAPLFPAPGKRDGYLRADPGRAEAVADVVLEASHAVGTFEKPLHVRVEPALCAHSRAGQIGCTRCLDLCPTGAIAPAGDHVAVDPLVCAGCGACSAACPSGAVAYDAPPVDETMARLRALVGAYREAGGAAPRLLVHDAHGAEMIRLAARHGRGLPVDVVPMEMAALGAFGHAEALVALAAGAGAVAWLPGPDVDRAALEAQAALTRALAPGAAASIQDLGDPDAMADALHGAETPAAIVAPVRPLGTRRQVARQAAVALSGADAVLPLPAGAPYGAVLVDTEACTLCLSCVSLCPSGALGDDPDRPRLRFQEDACLQCGLCATICPEDAITLEPRMDLTPAALAQRTLHEEEPFACIECGAAFGVRSTIERVSARLAGHAMFQGDRARMIQMCDDCRVRAQMHGDAAPFAAAPRPRVRTTDDDLAARARRDG